MTEKRAENTALAKVARKKFVINRYKRVLPACAALHSRLNTRNKYKVHLQTFIHARSRRPSPWWCMPAERWNGKKNNRFLFSLKRGAGTDELCQMGCVELCAWTEWAPQTVHFHWTRTHSHVPGKGRKAEKEVWTTTRHPGCVQVSERHQSVELLAELFVLCVYI